MFCSIEIYNNYRQISINLDFIVKLILVNNYLNDITFNFMVMTSYES